jgi:hypothetical protein
MTEERGTLEKLIDELAILLSPLTSLTPEAAPTLLADLGLPVTPAKANQLASAMTKTTGAMGKLIDLAFEIEKAIEDEKWEKVLEKGIAAIEQIAKLISGFVALENALGNLSLPNAGPILAAFPERLFSYLLARYLGRSPGVNEMLQLTGLLERTDHNVGSIDPNAPFYTVDEFHFGRIGGWLTDPKGQLEDLYDWDKPGFDGKKVLSILDRIVGEAGFPVLYDSQAPRLDLVVAEIVPRTNLDPRGLEVRFGGIKKGSIERTGDFWKLLLSLEANLPAGASFVLQPGKITFDPPDATTFQGKLGATYSYLRPAADPLKLVSLAASSYVSVEEIAASVGLDVKAGGKAGLELGADLKRGKVLLTTENQDGFIAKILSGFKVEQNFDLGVGFSTDEGVHFHGSSTLEIQLASHIELGPIELSALTLSVGIDDGKFPVGIATDIKASLGPLVAVVQGIGFELIFELVDGNEGNLGPVDLGAGFKPPKGVGLSLDVGVVKGGGYLFFDFEKEEYGGALELNIANIVNAKAIGIITTRMPDGSKGFALLIIITAEFSPAFQLGYGFTLNGVGGLLGINRTVKLETLREGVRTGAVNSIMFPQNVVENAPQIISDLRAVFPPEEGIFLFGPMAKLGWGTPTLVSLSFGLILEIPGNIAILGVLKIALPADDTTLIQIQVNFVGTLDFDKGMLTFDASLYDSRVLFITLEGDMAVRFKWSDPAGFLVSIGGFHPSYTPPAELEVPPMKRLAINILDTDWARIRIETYFAVTSNSFQFGARAELYLGFDAFYVDGYFGLDVLFRFSPFYFEVSICAGFCLHVFGADLLSIKLAFTLSGPSPWHAWGTGSVTILFWEISADFDITWGDAEDTALPDVAVVPLLIADLDKSDHWRALPPASANLWVTLRAIDEPNGALLLHPAGALSVTQKVAPLDFTWERIGNQRPSDVKRASIASAKSGGLTLKVTSIDDSFARSHFEDLSDAQKLSVPSFERMHCGAKLGLANDVMTGPGVHRTIEYEIVVIDKEYPKPFKFGFITGLLAPMLAGGPLKKAKMAKAYKKLLVPHGDDVIKTQGESFTVASTTDNTAHGAHTTFPSEAMAQQFLAQEIARMPAMADALHVIPTAEVNGS